MYQAKDAVNQIKDLTNPDILATKKPEWNLSNATVGHKNPENHAQNLFNVTILIVSINMKLMYEFQVRFGLKDEKILPPKDPFVYAGTDTRNIYHDDWNVSNEVPIPLHQHKKIQEE